MIVLARNGTRPVGGRDTARLTWAKTGANEEGGPAEAPRTIATYDGRKGIDAYRDLPGVIGRNRLIQGDNLQAMRHLLATGYGGRVDLIYIDPPFWSGDDYYTNDGQDVLAVYAAHQS